jgi:hypothetical protein
MNPHLGAGGHIFIHLQSGYIKKTVTPKHGIYYFSIYYLLLVSYLSIFTIINHLTKGMN